MLTRLVCGKYVIPYQERKVSAGSTVARVHHSPPLRQFKMDFAIIIAVSKENIRPTMPKATPDVLRVRSGCVVWDPRSVFTAHKTLVEKCWDRDKGVRLTAKEFAEALQKLHVIYKQNKEEWDPLVGSEVYPDSLPPPPQ